MKKYAQFHRQQLKYRGGVALNVLYLKRLWQPSRPWVRGCLLAVFGNINNFDYMKSRFQSMQSNQRKLRWLGRDLNSHLRVI